MKKGAFRIAGADRLRLLSAQEAISTLSVSATMGAGLGAVLRDLLETEKVSAHSLKQRPRGDDLTVEMAEVAGFPSDTFRRVFDRWLVGRGVMFGTYNALRPEPRQRNRVLSCDELSGFGAGDATVRAELYPKLAAAGHKTLRVLVCDGASLLGWVGLIQSDQADEKQRALLTALTPALHLRLFAERAIHGHGLERAAMDAALEEISTAAYVVDRVGRVVHANACGRRLSAGRSSEERDAVRAAVKGEAGRHRVARLAHGDGYLVIAQGSPAPAGAVRDFASRIGLTPGQTRVVDLLARGLSNRTIAAELGLAERTVETHVTAILEKAQADSRAALLARILTSRP